MAEMITQCPWGRGIHKLVANDVDGVQKTWLVKEMVDNGKSCAEMSKRFRLKKATLKKWKLKCLNGSILHNAAGRPKLVTDDQRKQLSQILSNGAFRTRETDCDNMIVQFVKDTCLE
jgi:hypothetical protein